MISTVNLNVGSRSMRKMGLGAAVLSAFVLGITPTVAAGASGWVIQPTPTPIGATQVTLNDVSCSAPTACFGVGYSTIGSSLLTLAERWTGTKWVVQHTPNPTGTAGAILNNVSCTSATACTAVGYHVTNSGHTLTLAEAWNGTKWTIQPTPNPVGTTNSELTGVSCTSTSACTAVGRYYGSPSIATLAEGWNGTKWVIQPTPNPTGDSVAEFYGVSCTATTACTGVGFALDGSNHDVMVSEAWNGTTWAMQSIPNPTGTTSAVLRGISCTSSIACVAVGDYIGSSFITTLAETWNGAIWAVQPTPNPSGGTTTSLLTGISCVSTTACTAIGFENISGGTVTLGEAWNGVNWVIQPTPNPAAATQSYLNGVSCPSVNACVAVGSTSNSSTAALVERHS
jgi:hypothetical protein